MDGIHLFSELDIYILNQMIWITYRISIYGFTFVVRGE